MERRERIAEHTPFFTTEWEGSCIRVTVEHPKLIHSVSSQMVIDSDMLDDLRYLVMPEDLKLLSEENPLMANIELASWKTHYERALKTREMIADQISWHLSHAIEKALMEKDNGQ